MKHTLRVVILGFLVLVAGAARTFAAPFAYIGHRGDNTVSVIDLATNTIVRTVVVGSGPGPMALAPDGSHMYVFSFDGSLSAIDTQTYTVITTQLGLPYINGIEVTPDGNFIYATGGGANTVWIIDARTYAVVTSFAVPPDNHDGMVFNPSGSRLYVSQSGFGGNSQTLSVVDPASTSVIANIDLPAQGATFMTIDPIGPFLYVAQGGYFYDGHTVTVIDTSLNQVVASIPVGQTPLGIAINSTGKRVYVANFYGQTVSVIDTATRSVIATVPVGQNPYGIAVTSDDREIIVTNESSSTVSIIDAATNSVSTTILVGTAPFSATHFVTHEALPAGPLITTTLGISDATFTYDGARHPATCSAVGSNGQPVMPVTLTYDGGSDPPLNAGVYAVTCSFAGDTTYRPAVAVASLSIRAATPRITVSGGSIIFDGAAHPASATATGVDGSSVGGSFTMTYVPGGSTVPVIAGSYVVTAAFASRDPNYTSASGIGLLMIRGLIGYWKFDERTGTTALDSSGNGHDGAVYGATYTTVDGADISGSVSALRFPGNIAVPYAPALDFTENTPFTFSFWLRPTADFTGEFSCIVNKVWPAGGASDYAICNGRDGVFALWWNGSWLENTSVATRRLDPGRLTHVAVVYDGAGTMRFYSDGQLDAAGGDNARGAFQGARSSARADLSIGGAFHGMLDDVRVYNRALSALEVSSLNSSRGLEVYEAFAPYSRAANLKAVLFSGTSLVAGKTVTFTLGGSVVGTAVTDAAGVATLTGVSVSGFDVGDHQSAIGATVPGDSQIPAGSAAAMVTIVPDTPAITWNLPVLPVGALSDASLLSATANVAGRFDYSGSPAGTPLTVGDQFCVTFTPTDQVHYTAVSQCVSITALGLRAEATLKVGSAPIPRVATGVVVDAARNLVYAATGADGTIAVLDGTTNRQVDSIQLRLGAVAGWASFIAVDSALNRLYVADAYSPLLWTIDAEHRTVIAATQVPYGGAWSGLAFNPTTRLLYLAVSDQNVVAVIDPANPAQAVALVPVTGLGALSSFAIDPITNLIFVATDETLLDPASGGYSAFSGIAILGGDPAAASSFNHVTSHLHLSSADLSGWLPPIAYTGPALAVNPRTHLLYAAAHSTGGAADTSVSVFDADPSHPTYAQLAARIQLPAGAPVAQVPTYYGFTYEAALAVDPVTNTVYVKVDASDPWPGGTQVTEIQAVDGATNAVSSLAIFKSDVVFPFDVTNSGALSVNSNTGRLYVTGGDDALGASTMVFLARRAAAVASTASSGPATVSTPQASVTFSGVTSGGTTTIRQIDASQLTLSVPSQFSLSNAWAYEIATTASVVPPIQLCFNASSVNDPSTFNALAVLHGEGGTWVDRTVSRDFASRTICAIVSSLSPFAIARIIDRTPPHITCGTGDAIWHRDDVSIACTAVDTGSGLSNPADAAFALSTSVASGVETTTATTSSRTICDRAGNCATAGPITGLKVDKRPPVISIGVPLGGTYLLNQVAAASYTCADGGSGITACAGPVANGGRLPTNAVGAATFVVSASDAVGHGASASASYVVAYGIASLYDQTKPVTSGSTVPVKIQLIDVDRRNVSASNIVVIASGLRSLAGATVAVTDSGKANAGAMFRYDATLGGYIFNLSTAGLPSGTYTLSLTAGGDPTTHALQIQVR
jgi:YVTN family beta-propeller protein